MPHRVAPQAETDLEDIAYYVFRETGSIDALALKRAIVGAMNERKPW